ncbi:ABC transporter-related protein [Anaeromyxobacter sp. K]|uniref:ABC transporter ATP-binding protein n=1 Tax=Anaeromyxobacter sp. (strain K) TaxID=447217 RepID=UPI00015F8706|nr:ATP-binding cassette domain-containing protein [Anaeromyxobacter sp. K]ACG71619.1 ABC transporter-related protein [Anaeromyxobacter sp. K]
MAPPVPSAPESVIAARDVHTRVGADVVHAGVTLDVRLGKIFALAGPSGCGKTLLLREALALHAPDSGSIRVLGREVVGLGEAEALALRRRCGVVFERGALFSSLTIAENVSLPLREHSRLGRRVRDELAALKIALVGLPAGAGTKYPSQLSGGMRRRAALARAIALDPELLVLDEPSAGLDPASGRELEELVRHLNEVLGLTVLVVTRDLGLLWNLADHVAFLAGGRIVAAGSMAEVSRSDEPLVRAYFPRARGAPPEARP